MTTDKGPTLQPQPRLFSQIVAHGTSKRTANAQEVRQWDTQPSSHVLARQVNKLQHEVAQAVDYLFINGKTIARTRLAPHRMVILSMHKYGASSRRITQYLQEAYNIKINSSNVRRFILKELLDIELLESQL